jgi:hypothetical protein
MLVTSTPSWLASISSAASTGALTWVGLSSVTTGVMTLEISVETGPPGLAQALTSIDIKIMVNNTMVALFFILPASHTIKS